MRVLAGARFTEERTDEAFDACLHPRFLGELADDGVGGRLVGIDPTRDEPPRRVVGAVHEEDAIVIVEHRRVGADLGGHVSDLGREACAQGIVIELGA